VGKKGGGGRVGYGTSASNKGPRRLGGPRGAGGRVTGGGTGAALRRAAGGSLRGAKVSLSHFRRQADLSAEAALAEADRLVAAGQAEYTYLSDRVAAVLRGHGQEPPVRHGRPVGGIHILTDTIA
jgi:hypothetical protein